MKRYVVEAVVLKNINYSDTNKIYTLFTKESGKITAIARGVRKLQSRRAGSLDTLNHVKIKISEDNKGFKTIQEAITINTYKKIKSNLKLIFKSLYLLEILNRYQEVENENPQIFSSLITSLNDLQNKDNIADLIVNHFEIALMKNLGFQMYLDKCAVCSREYDEAWSAVKFNYELGGFVCDMCRETGIRLDNKTATLLNKLAKSEHDSYQIGEISKEMLIVDRLIKNFMLGNFDEMFRFSKAYSLINSG